MSEQTSTIYTEDELVLLEKTKKIRVDIADNMTKNGVPNNVAEIRVLNEVLTTLDKSINETVANRLKHNENENKEALLDTVALALSNISKTKTAATDRVIDAPEEYIPDDIVPGETDIGVSQLNPSDFINTDEE